MYYRVGDNISNELCKLTNLIIHIVTTNIEDLPGDPFSVVLDTMDDSPHNIGDVDERPPLLAPTHYIYDALLPSAQRHDIDRKIESHARRKPKDRGIAKNDGLKISISKATQQFFHVQLAFGI